MAAKLLTNGEARRARLDADGMWELGSRAERSDDGEASSALAMLKIATASGDQVRGSVQRNAPRTAEAQGAQYNVLRTSNGARSCNNNMQNAGSYGRGS